MFVLEKSIEVKNVTKEYPGIIAVKNMTFSVEKGAVHGFLGPNGAGNSTTMKMICGLITPTEGNIHIDGMDMREKSGLLKRKLGFFKIKF